MRGKSAISGPTKTVEYNVSDKSLFTRVLRWNVARFSVLRRRNAGDSWLVWSGRPARLPFSNGPVQSAHWVNWMHLSFGVFLLAVATISHKTLQLGLALLGAIAGTTIGLVGLLILPHVVAGSGTLLWVDLSDPLAHLAVGVLAILPLRNSRREQTA